MIRAFSIVATTSLLVACVQAPLSDRTETVPLYEESAFDEKADSASLQKKFVIDDYTAVWQAREAVTYVVVDWELAISQGDRGLIIRSFRRDGVLHYLWVDGKTAETYVVPADELDLATRVLSDEEARAIPYFTRLLAQDGRALDSLVPDSESSGRFAITIDMCQSKRRWELDFYENLIALGEELGQALPIGVAMTGVWAYKHPREFAQLAEWDRTGKLDISWINHSFHHYVMDSHGEYRFLTSSWVDMSVEVLVLETMLLEQGQTFSPLFRFPGLYYNENRLAEVRDYGLFALDADAWIAKGQPIQDDAVVLLHGNGNEHNGIVEFESELDAFVPSLKDGTWRVVPPRYAILAP